MHLIPPNTDDRVYAAIHIYGALLSQRPPSADAVALIDDAIKLADIMLDKIHTEP